MKELGTHEELLAKRGIYYTLHELQFQDSQAAAELIGAAGNETSRSSVGRQSKKPTLSRSARAAAWMGSPATDSGP